MLSNVQAAGALLTTERVATELTAVVGRLAAHDAVADCVRRARAGAGELPDVLAEDPVVGATFDRSQLTDLLDPARNLGSAREFVRRALAEHHVRKDRR
jgi:3-carboxy-cis,cis-muconate cycloisomerase